MRKIFLRLDPTQVRPWIKPRSTQLGLSVLSLPGGEFIAVVKNPVLRLSLLGCYILEGTTNGDRLLTTFPGEF